MELSESIIENVTRRRLFIHVQQLLKILTIIRIWIDVVDRVTTLDQENSSKNFLLLQVDK